MLRYWVMICTSIFARGCSASSSRAALRTSGFDKVTSFLAASMLLLGSLALVLGAWDGIYIGGGIVKRYPDLLRTSSFRSGFENKGRYRSMMEKVPTFLILHDQPGLLGASYCARQMHRA